MKNANFKKLNGTMSKYKTIQAFRIEDNKGEKHDMEKSKMDLV